MVQCCEIVKRSSDRVIGELVKKKERYILQA